ncbi:MAG: glucose-methanol-choline oxidoreductase [Rhodoferax sp.]|nr:glucose-methanol-choline oxidoreductase [Rhodoferax sp.]
MTPDPTASVDSRADTFDYVIVGGGSAGCALAGRLSEDGRTSVCLLEAGGTDRSALIRAPMGFATIATLGVHNWRYQTVPQPGLDGRRGYQPRGRVLGGSSSVNAMVYTRGQPQDYDGWRDLGNPGWGFDDVLPYFKAGEHSECFGPTPYHGMGGPLNVCFLRSPSAINRAFVSACVEQGLPYNPDYNGASQLGCSPAQVTQKNGERWNAARAYLPEPGRRPLLDVRLQATTQRLLLEGRRAVGVEYRQGGRLQQVRARREVLVCAGAFGSPQLLMLSGIGPGAHLQSLGIPVALDLPGVGSNLQDHITTVLIHRTAQAADTFGLSWRGALAIWRGIREWREQRSGIVTSNVAETQGFLSTEPATGRPDIQLAFCTGIVDDHTRKPHRGHGYTLHVTLMRPNSRGTVRLASARPQDAPLIDPAFLSDQDDLRRLAAGSRMGYDILHSPALDRYRGELLYPFPRDDEAGVHAFLRRHSDTEYHPCGSCQMGPHPAEGAVVDARLRVHGMEGLRVADASVMPRIVSGNTNAPTLMIAEKAAALMRAAA